MQYRWIAAVLLVGGLVTLASGARAYAAGVSVQATVSPATGLSNGQTVTFTASGLAASSPGTILECDDAPTGVTQTSVMLGAPVNQPVSVGCTPPSYSHVVSTKADGTVSTTFAVVAGTLGPPCGPAPDIATCPPTDSAGTSPAADAPAYPCPPTAAQATQGFVCHLTFGDAAGDSAQATLAFAGSTAPTTAAPAGTTPTTAAPAGTTPTTAKPATSSSGATSAQSAASAPSSASAAAPASAPSSGTLATTGPPSWLWGTLVAGVVTTSLGALLWFAPTRLTRRRVALGHVAGNGCNVRSGSSDLWIRDP
jgi:hypothetical protein